MQLSIQQTLPPTANGIYTVNAPSFISVSLFWADKNGALDNWTSFANILITPDGEGRFVFDGERAVPQEATLYTRRRCDRILHTARLCKKYLMWKSEGKHFLL